MWGRAMLQGALPGIRHTATACGERFAMSVNVTTGAELL